MNTTALTYHIDLEELLKPISPVLPAGESLRYEGTYDQIREARREDDATLSQGIYKSQLKRADWDADQTLCIEALENRTKDLQIAGWLLEAWLHLGSFAGVESGLNVVAGLCERFWDDLYPKLDGDSVEDRVAPIEWINDKLSVQLKLLPLTQPLANDVRPHSYLDWENACHLENLARKGPGVLQQALAEGKATMASFQGSVISTDPSFFFEVAADVNGALEACSTLQELLDEKCGKDSPSLQQFKDSLRLIHQLVSELVRTRDEETAFDEVAEDQTETEITGDEVPRPLVSPIRNRAEAYRRLSEVADYLLATEPHSPTPYLIKRAVEWGHMTLLEIYQQIIRNDGEMQEIDRLLRLTRRDGGV